MGCSSICIFVEVIVDKVKLLNENILVLGCNSVPVGELLGTNSRWHMEQKEEWSIMDSGRMWLYVAIWKVKKSRLEVFFIDVFLRKMNIQVKGLNLFSIWVHYLWVFQSEWWFIIVDDDTYHGHVTLNRAKCDMLRLRLSSTLNDSWICLLHSLEMSRTWCAQKIVQ